MQKEGQHHGRGLMPVAVAAASLLLAAGLAGCSGSGDSSGAGTNNVGGPQTQSTSYQGSEAPTGKTQGKIMMEDNKAAFEARRRATQGQTGGGR